MYCEAELEMDIRCDLRQDSNDNLLLEEVVFP